MAIAALNKFSDRKWNAYIVALIVALFGYGYYFYRIGCWLAYDDEGGYLYAAWRIGQGEMPYRDFLTPKLPLFLYTGALLLKLSGNSTLFLRIVSATAVTLSAFLLYLTVRRIFGTGAALLAMVAFLMHRDVYWSARFFRPEAYMLFYSMVGIYLFVRSYPDRRWGLAISGLVFALATITRLFGVLPMAGCLLFAIYDNICRYLALTEGYKARLPTGKSSSNSGVNPGKISLALFNAGTKNIMWFLIPYIILVSASFSTFYYLAPNFFDSILGHHLRQGKELSHIQVFLKGLGLYWLYLKGHPVLLLLTVPALVRSLKARDRLQAFFTFQLPTAIVFLFISRELEERHMVHLVPSIAALFGASIDYLLSNIKGKKGITISILILIIALWPSWRKNLTVAGWEESDTLPLARYIQALTAESDYVLSDYPGINFYARRRTTPLGAGLSRGAARGGQILGRDLIEEIEKYGVKMVLVNVAQGSHQMANLRDYDKFHRYVQEHFHLIGRVIYDYRPLEVYCRDDLIPVPMQVNFGGKIMLTGLAWGDRPIDLIDPSKSSNLTTVEAGGEITVTLRWQALAQMERDYYLVLRLMDEEGNLWGIGQKQLLDIEVDTYWDEKGLERAILYPTSQWPVGEVVLDYYKLPVLPGTPPGRYRIMARLRPLNSWNGLEILSPGGAPSGFDYLLGTIRVTRPAHPPPPIQLTISHPLIKNLGNELQLLGYELNSTKVRPGDTLHITLLWRALKRMTGDYKLILELQDESGRVWSKKNFPVASIEYPTTQWMEGELIRGQYNLVVDASTPPGRYHLAFNLMDGETGLKLLKSNVPLAELQVAGRKRLFAPPKEIQHPLQANIGNLITFLGYDLMETEVKPGGTLHLTLYWQAQHRMDKSYKVFTHLLDAQEKIWGQKDSIPVEGTSPTTGWLPGEVIVDTYQITVKPEAPPGDYQIEIGMYDPKTMQRLPIFDERGQRLPNDRILLDRRIKIK